MHDLHIWGLSLTLTGFIVLAVLFVLEYYKKLFVDGETIETEATVKSLKRTYSRYTEDTICPVVEYSFEGKLMTAHHYIQVPANKIDFNRGETVTIEVNPRKPKVFRMKSIEAVSLEDRMKRNTIILAVLGGVLLLAGIIMLTVTLLS